MHPRFHAIQVNPCKTLFYVDVHGNNTAKQLQILDIRKKTKNKNSSNENLPKQNLHVVEEQHLWYCHSST